MNILTVDFETYYSQDFSLTKMTTEEYIRSPEFEVIGVSVQVDDAEPVWFSGDMPSTEDWLRQFDWERSFALAHNAIFDGAILSWLFDIKPKGWLDTLSMGRALHGSEVGGSLAVLAQHYGLGEKGTEVVNAKGLRRADFPTDQLARYGEYCKNDVALTYKLFNQMGQDFPLSELKLIDLTVRMFSEPVLRIDTRVLNERLTEVRKKKQALLDAVTMVDKDQLMSNHKLAATLKLMGVQPPMKTSPANGMQTYAFSKTDEEFRALLEHEDERVQAIVAARLGVKSTLEETRIERFIEIAERGTLPVPLRYYAAHTGRWGGDDKLNLQNLPRGSKMKSAICAPAGYVFIDSDSSQIEARTLAWLAEQDDLVKAFEAGEDVYKIMASAIYRKPVADIDKNERFIGKTAVLGCFGADTKVLTDSGWKSIVEVNATDRVWDGESWVEHQGVIPKGEREVIHAWGVDATPEHEILTEHGWREWREVVTNPTLSQSAFAKARLLSLIGSSTSNPWVNPQGGTLLSDVTVDGRGRWTVTISKWGGLQDATHAPKGQLTILVKSIGGMNQSSQTWSIGKDYLTASQASFQGVVQKHVKRIRTMVGEVSRCMNLGVTPALNFYSTLSLCLTGTTRHAISTESTITKGMCREIFGLPPAVKTSATDGQSKICKRKLPTYDIAYAGPNNRYMIATNAGALIVHNCGYGMGASKFQAQLKTSKVNITEKEAEHIINTYRDTYPKIAKFWRAAGKALDAILQNQHTELGRGGLLKVEGKKGILLPNGLYLRYPNLRKMQDDDGNPQYVYDSKKGKQVIATKIYGGKVTENVCQALARIVIGEQMLRVAKKYKVVMTVHDAIACIAPKAEADNAKEYVELCMQIRPSWAPDLPLNCEAGCGASYGDC